MGSDEQLLVLLAHEKRAGQMHCIERSDQSWKRLGGTFQNECRERDQGNAVDRLEDVGTLP